MSSVPSMTGSTNVGTGIALSDPYSTWAGVAIDALNFGTSLGFGIYDRQYNQQVNDQAQKNWEAQMAFAKEQFGYQQGQAEKNRIRNLMLEYSEAGLNPLLASGMGASTAGVISGAGNAGLHSYQPQRVQELKFANANMMFQNSLQKALNDATINKLNSEANKNNAEADDLEFTRTDRINKLRSDSNLSEKEAEKVVELTNKIIEETKEVDANIANLTASALQKQIQNVIEVQTGKKLRDMEMQKIEQDIRTQKKNNRLNTWSQVRNWIDMFLTNGIKAGYLASFVGR